MTRSTTRVVAASQALAGVVLATRPDTATRVAGIRSPNVPPAWLVRILGTRMALQGAVTVARPSPDVALLGVAVDVTHAVSMAVVAAASARYRKGALVSGSLATASAFALAMARRAESG